MTFWTGCLVGAGLVAAVVVIGIYDVSKRVRW